MKDKQNILNKTNNNTSDVPDWIINKWQELVDLLAYSIDVPSVLIMKTGRKYMEVFIASRTENNPYQIGDKEKMAAGFYCERDLKSKKELIISNALKDKEWSENPNLKLGMISYLGFSINYPNGINFGTISVFDNKENKFNGNFIKLGKHFRDIIENDLFLLQTFEHKVPKEVTTIAEHYKKITNQNKELIKAKEELMKVHESLEEIVVKRTQQLQDEVEGHRKSELALQESEEKLKAILKTIPDFLFHFDNKGKFIDYYQENKNDKLFLKSEKFINKLLSDIFEPELAAKMLKKISEAIYDGESQMEYQLLMGELKHFDAKFSSLNQNEVIVSVRDITDRKQSEKEIKESEAKLRELNATKNKLFSIIAHDLKSPFNIILGSSGLLIEYLKEFDVDKTEKYLSYINSSARETLILLDNLLNWTKSQTGQIKFNPKILHLSPIIQTILKSSYSLAKIKSISLNHIQAMDVEIYSDENMLKTILRNLISNAMKFTNPGGNIDVSVESNQGCVEILVSDNGVGIDNEKLKKLFDLSVDISTSGTSDEKGSGLGLVLCKEFIDKLGGRILVESHKENMAEGIIGGSHFKVVLPINK
ncbi:PAS domain-containing sensor histidine kinase [Lentimicrobium sp. L6]|uniref:PAS domain-containing sensor histidine kinase n=1 Tax=Lentimicrobium sp. L6 TaxID=2735916 RepID=UPI0015550387|nr:PAS domain-containing sensor histidine kinase [Lentimicrobium sp. L6]NPD84922.1 PAS domain-containing sensor histidine kinase [Lentimicrobium sp. L6]